MNPGRTDSRTHSINHYHHSTKLLLRVLHVSRSQDVLQPPHEADTMIFIVPASELSKATVRTWQTEDMNPASLAPGCLLQAFLLCLLKTGTCGNKRQSRRCMYKGQRRERIIFCRRPDNSSLGSALCLLAFANLTLGEIAETIFFWP